MHTRKAYRLGLALAALVVLTSTIFVGVTAQRWIGQSFPGFFLLPNRVIASVGLPDWPSRHEGGLYQRRVLAVEGTVVHSGGEIYAAASRVTPGTPVEYTLRQDGGREIRNIPAQRLGAAEYWLIFGSYQLSGLAYLTMGLVGAWVFPGQRRGLAMLSVGATGGLYALSATTLYGAGALFPVHAVLEALFPAALVYVALVFPRELPGLVRPIGTLAVWLSAALAVPYIMLLGDAEAYTLLHRLCETYLGVAGMIVCGRFIVYATTHELDALDVGALAGAVAGLAVPGVVMLASGLAGGGIPVNVCTAAAFLFPLGFAIGALRMRPHAPTHVEIPA